MNKHYNQIKDATTALLNSDDYTLIVPAIHALHNTFSQLTGVNASDDIDGDINLPTGKAISPVKAARCLMEFERTRRFLRGIKKAIDDLMVKKPTGKINILYAGCGPYATLLTPLTSVYTSEQVNFCLLDINPQSLCAARALYTELGLLGYVTKFLQEDATTYQVNPADDFDMMISETMLNALQREPMLSVKVNLATQLKSNGVFIPQAVKIDAALLNPGQEQNTYMGDGTPAKRVLLGPVYTTALPISLPKLVRLPLPPIASHRQLALLTEIDVYADERLSNYNTSLTLPWRLKFLDMGNEFNAVEFEYLFSDKPRFAYKLLSGIN